MTGCTIRPGSISPHGAPSLGGLAAVGRLKPGGLLGAGLAFALVVCVGFDPVVAARPQAPGQRTAAYERVIAITEQGHIPASALSASYPRVMELKRVYG